MPWQAIEDLQPAVAVESEWERRAGDGLLWLRRYLQPLPDLAQSIQLDAHEPHRVVVHGQDDIVTVCPDTGETEPILRSDVVLYRLDLRRLVDDLAAVLGLRGTSRPLDGSARVWLLGDFVPIEGERFPVYLCIPRDPDEGRSMVERCTLAFPRPPIVVTPTSRHVDTPATAVVGARNGATLTLAATLRVTADQISADVALDKVLASFVRTHVFPMVEGPSARRFATPPGVRWGDITIRFLDGSTVSISVGSISERHTYSSMGFEDQRSRKPTVQWELLRTFAQEHCHLTWKSSSAGHQNQKRKESLSKQLRAFFGIADDPFELRDNGWYAKLRLIPD